MDALEKKVKITKKGLHFFIVLILMICLALPVSAQEPKTASVPIIMYHSLRNGGGDTSISPDAFEADLKYLAEAGYETVFISDLVSFVVDGVPLPEKAIVLTFDDGYYNNYSVGLPLAEKYDAKIVVSVIGKDTEIWSEADYVDEGGGHLTWTQICEMADSGRVEICNHTWDLHKICDGRKGCSIAKGEEPECYRGILSEDVSQLQQALQENCGLTPTVFTYPFGAYCCQTTEILKEMGFSATVLCFDGMDTLTQGDASCLYELHRYNRTPDRSVKAILKLIEDKK